MRDVLWRMNNFLSNRRFVYSSVCIFGCLFIASDLIRGVSLPSLLPTLRHGKSPVQISQQEEEVTAISMLNDSVKGTQDDDKHTHGGEVMEDDKDLDLEEEDAAKKKKEDAAKKKEEDAAKKKKEDAAKKKKEDAAKKKEEDAAKKKKEEEEGAAQEHIEEAKAAAAAAAAKKHKEREKRKQEYFADLALHNGKANDKLHFVPKPGPP